MCLAVFESGPLSTPASEARIEATAGLQISQPSSPRPCSASSRAKVSIRETSTISYSSERLCSKWEHSAFEVSTPAAFSSLPSSGTQEPQPVPALVHALIAPTSAQPCSRIVVMIVPLVTLWQLHTVAESGSASGPIAGAPPRLAGSSSCSGVAGSGASVPASGRSVS